VRARAEIRVRPSCSVKYHAGGPEGSSQHTARAPRKGRRSSAPSHTREPSTLLLGLQRDKAGRAGPRDDAPHVELAGDLFPTTRRFFTVAGLLVLLLVAWFEVAQAKADWTLWLQFGVLAISLAGAWTPTSLRLRVWGLSAGLSCTGLLAAARYGPMAGSAVLLVAASFVASAGLGRRAANVMTGLSLTGFAAVGLAAVEGWLRPTWPGLEAHRTW
jgi:hypothetical protein